MIKVGQQVIVPMSDDEAALCLVLMKYKGGILRVAELNKRGVPLKSKRWFVREEDVTPVP